MMNGRKRTSPGAGTPRLAKSETGTTCEVASIPCEHSTTASVGRQVVAEWLGVGEENAQTMKQLLGFLNGDSRIIRLQIERERRGGYPILSGQSGYWIAASVDEINSFCRSMRHRARQIWASAANVERAAGLGKHNPMPGQCNFWDGGDT